MIPDLGKYAETVLSAYAASLLLLAVIVLFSLIRGRRIRAKMKQIEDRMTPDG